LVLDEKHPEKISCDRDSSPLRLVHLGLLLVSALPFAGYLHHSLLDAAAPVTAKVGVPRPTISHPRSTNNRPPPQDPQQQGCPTARERAAC
jgi:hypothetical protein